METNAKKKKRKKKRKNINDFRSSRSEGKENGVSLIC